MALKQKNETAELESLCATLQLAEPNAIFMSLPNPDTDQLTIYFGNLRAVILCKLNMPLFVIEQLTGELVTWGECASLALALQATMDALQFFAYRSDLPHLT